MARLRKTSWSSVFKKSMKAVTRSALRAGSRAVTQAVKAAIKTAQPGPVKRAGSAVSKTARKTARGIARSAGLNTAGSTAASTIRSPARSTPTGGVGRSTPQRAATGSTALAPAGGDWSRGVALGPGGARVYHLYQPPGLSRAAPAPLLVMLHGCGQTAEAFATSTRMNRLAATQGCCVLYPEQDRRANPQGCWNWYATRSRAAYAEAATLLAAIDQVALFHPIDAGRVAVAGLSAGAGMAALLASRHPQRFRAVAMHSGVPPGTAHSSASALGAMLGARRPVAPAAEANAATWPPLLVIHGSADSVVAAVNGRAAAQMWAEAAGARPGPPRRLQRGLRHPATVTDYTLRGRVVVSLCEIDGLAHAWSGGAASQAHGDALGPDASRMVMAFAMKAFAAQLPVTAV